MPKILLPIIFCFLYSTANAQVQITIKSVIDSSILPYATILDVTNNILRSANKNGVCNIVLEENKTFRISYVGFADKDFTVNITDKSKSIFLLPKATTLKAVLLQPCLITKETKIKSVFKNGRSIFHSVGSFKVQESNGKIAAYMGSKRNWSKLQKLSFWTKQNQNAPDYAIKSPFAISFYSVDTLTKTPGELLSLKPIFIFPTKVGKQTIELDSIGIDIDVPKEGMFVCFEFILDTAFQWINEVDGVKIPSQGILLECGYSLGYDLVSFDYKSSTWKTTFMNGSTDPTKLHLSLNLEAVYKICKK